MLDIVIPLPAVVAVMALHVTVHLRLRRRGRDESPPGAAAAPECARAPGSPQAPARAVVVLDRGAAQAVAAAWEHGALVLVLCPGRDDDRPAGAPRGRWCGGGAGWVSGARDRCPRVPAPATGADPDVALLLLPQV